MRYVANAMNALTGVFEKIKGINGLLFAILFGILPSVIAYFIAPVYVKLKPSNPDSFWSVLPLVVVSVLVPVISACLVTWFLNKWYNSTEKDLLRVRSRQRNLFMRVPFTENKSLANGYSIGDSFSYTVWSLSLVFPGIMINIAILIHMA